MSTKKIITGLVAGSAILLSACGSATVAPAHRSSQASAKHTPATPQVPVAPVPATTAPTQAPVTTTTTAPIVHKQSQAAPVGPPTGSTTPTTTTPTTTTPTSTTPTSTTPIAVAFKSFSVSCSETSGDFAFSGVLANVPAGTAVSVVVTTNPNGVGGNTLYAIVQTSDGAGDFSGSVLVGSSAYWLAHPCAPYLAQASRGAAFINATGG